MNKNILLLMTLLLSVVCKNSFSDESYEEKKKQYTLNIEAMDQITELNDMITSAKYEIGAGAFLVLAGSVGFGGGIKMGAFKSVENIGILKKFLKAGGIILTTTAGAAAGGGATLIYFTYGELLDLQDQLALKNAAFEESNDLILKYQ